MNEVEYAWAAGFFEGEGCFALSRTSGKGQHETTRNAVVHVGQNDLAPLFRLVAMFGGQPRNFRVTSAGNQAYQWTITGKAVIPVIEAVLPFMTDGVKKVQAQAVLDYAKTIGSRGGNMYHRPLSLRVVRRQHIIDRHISARRVGDN